MKMLASRLLRDDSHDVIAIALRTKVAGRDAPRAEAHLRRKLIDLSAEELRQPWMSAFGAELRFALAQRHQFPPLPVERGELRHRRYILRAWCESRARQPA